MRRSSTSIPLMIALAAAAIGKVSAQDFDLMTMGDRDEDGRLSPTELTDLCDVGWSFLAFGEDSVNLTQLPPLAQLFSICFPPGMKGEITLHTYRAGVVERFKKLDTNHDGFLDAAEIRAAGVQKT